MTNYESDVACRFQFSALSPRLIPEGENQVPLLGWCGTSTRECTVGGGMTSFSFLDPIQSFGNGQRGRISRRLFDKSGQPRLTVSAWECGSEAYGFLCSRAGMEPESVSFFDTFIETSTPFIDDWLFSTFSEAVFEKRLTLCTPEGLPIEDPTNHLNEFRGYPWFDRARVMLRFLVQLGAAPDSTCDLQTFGAYFSMVALLDLDHAILAENVGDVGGKGESLIEATWMVGQLNKSIRSGIEAATLLKKMDSDRASRNAKIKHSKDPIQQARDFAHECWEAWQKNPQRYKYATEFARDMVEKMPNILTSEVVVTRWVRKWSRGMR